MIRIERHRLGPRVHLLGRRVHEYQLGFALLAVARTRAATLAGLFLVAKDWPDLFPGTRDRASWRWGIHRLPGKTLSFLLAALAVATLSPEASAKRPRPSDVPSAQTAVAPNDRQLFNDYATPARTYSSARVVVHYVALGIDAPPLNDDDGDAVPDYVERVGGAADAAIEYFERRGFRRIRPDSGGPDPRPDLYVSRFSPGVLGVALPAARAEGGAFVVVSNGLDPSAGRSFASVYATVAHELFHLVQFSYFPADEEPELPTWVLEGTAAGLEGRVHPELDDIVWSIQLRRWLAAPHRSVTTQSYGAQLLWRHLDERQPRLLPALLERFAARPVADEGEQVVAETYARVTGGPFAPAFHQFAVSVADDHAAAVTPLRTLRRGQRYRAAVVPLAVHYVRLAVPQAGPISVTVTFTDRTAAADATLAYQWESEVPGHPNLAGRIRPRVSDSGKTLTFAVPASVTASTRFVSPMLVVTNGGAAGRVAYRVRAR